MSTNTRCLTCHQQSKIEDYIFKMTLRSPRGQWVNSIILNRIFRKTSALILFIVLNKNWHRFSLQVYSWRNERLHCNSGDARYVIVGAREQNCCHGRGAVYPMMTSWYRTASSITLIARFKRPTCPFGPRWAPCWPRELGYQDILTLCEGTPSVKGSLAKG